MRALRLIFQIVLTILATGGVAIWLGGHGYLVIGTIIATVALVALGREWLKLYSHDLPYLRLPFVVALSLALGLFWPVCLLVLSFGKSAGAATPDGGA